MDEAQEEHHYFRVLADASDFVDYNGVMALLNGLALNNPQEDTLVGRLITLADANWNELTEGIQN